ncbi:MAG: ribosome biogenesis GTPase Der, partial [Bacillales bacterium]|nr:ribosome biogenesis GTPase Der [Bacillales bacterium]
MIEGTIALIGRPNVGKSTLFNRLVKERISIVNDTPGVTRDRIYGNFEWLGRNFAVIDTGGITQEKLPFQQLIAYQANIAMQDASVIIFIVDGKVGATEDDEFIANILRRSQKPVILAVSKTDDGHLLDRLYDLYSLGFGEPIGYSGLHGVGVGDLLDKVNELIPITKAKNNKEKEISFSIIGRPNVGKSSLVNAILNEERVIVSEIEGTTRDAINTTFKRNEKVYTVIDTAGLRRRGNIGDEIDRFSNIRTINAIENSDIVVLMLDGHEGVRELDKNIVGYAIQAEKPIIIAVNKWDLVIKDSFTMATFTDTLKKEFQFLEYVPIVYISALNNQRVQTLFDQIDIVYNNANNRVQTSVLNDILMDLQMRNPASNFNGGRIR